MPAVRTPVLDDPTLDALEELLAAAYGRPGWRDEVARIGAIDAQAWAVVEEDGALVGCACGCAWGPIGWVGLVATRPGHERRGIGRVATEAAARHLAARGCETIALDASAKGHGLYVAMGYAELGHVRELAIPAGVPDGARPARELPPGASLDAVAALDRRAFGGDRRPLLERLRAEGHPVLVVDGPDGALAGYAMALPRGVVGPAAALDEAAAQGLVAAGARHAGTGPARIMVPPGSRHAALLARLGCTETRALVHMRTGRLEIHAERDLLLGQASYAVG